MELGSVGRLSVIFGGRGKDSLRRKFSPLCFFVFFVVKQFHHKDHKSGRGFS
jgi:hypothetical protein